MKYSVIYADPPWIQKAGRKMNGYKIVDGIQIWNGLDSKTQDVAYPTLTTEEICAMPVSSIAASDAHLYLWATNKSLPEAFRVISAWGFLYSTTIVWAKNLMGGGLGGTHRINTEFLLFATKGNLKALRKSPSTWHHVKRGYENGHPCHSKKPAYFRELIESISPGKKIELFARQQSEGWDVFGNEVPNSITL